jgi:hypothetical protein
MVVCIEVVEGSASCGLTETTPKVVSQAIDAKGNA